MGTQPERTSREEKFVAELFYRIVQALTTATTAIANVVNQTQPKA